MRCGCLRPSLLLLILTVASSLDVVAPQSPPALPPWEFQTMYWAWSGPSNNTWTQCRSLVLSWWQIPQTSPPIQGPFTFTFYLEGNEPYVLHMGDGTQVGKDLVYDWVVDLPTGGPYQVSLNDANGASGGDGPYMYVVGESPPVSACSPVVLVPSALSLATSNDLSQCATVNVSLTGGTAPYIFSVIQQDILPKVITFESGEFEYVLDIKAGINVTFAVADSTGKGAVGPMFNVGQSVDSSCLTVAATLLPLDPGLSSVYPGASFAPSPTSSTGTSAAGHGVPTTSSTGTSASSLNPSTKRSKTITIVAGVVVGVGLLLLAGVIGACWQRRQSRRRGRDGNVDLAEASESFHGHPSVPDPTPYTLAGGHPHPAKATDEMGMGMGMMTPYGVVPYVRGAAYYDNAFPADLGASPPYTPSDPALSPTFTGTSSSQAYQHPHHSTSSRRYSGDSKTDSSAFGQGSTFTTANPNMHTLEYASAFPVRQGDRWGAVSPPLPPGAAPPSSPVIGLGAGRPMSLPTASQSGFHDGGYI